jgi:dTMP kinase
MDKTFLVFEGIDGSGKRTMCKYSQSLYKKTGTPVAKYQYPDYKSPWGKIIHDFLSGSTDLDVTVQFLTYATDILKDQEKIRTQLKNNIILADRYITSTVAFQCARGFDLKKAIQFVTLFDVIPPDIIFYMNVSPETSKKRKKEQKGKLDRHETDIPFLKKVNHMYKILQDKQFLAKKWIEIDAEQSIDTVKAAIKSEIDKIAK